MLTNIPLLLVGCWKGPGAAQLQNKQITTVQMDLGYALGSAPYLPGSHRCVTEQRHQALNGSLRNER